MLALLPRFQHSGLALTLRVGNRGLRKHLGSPATYLGTPRYSCHASILTRLRHFEAPDCLLPNESCSLPASLTDQQFADMLRDPTIQHELVPGRAIFTVKAHSGRQNVGVSRLVLPVPERISTRQGLVLNPPGCC